MHQDEQAVSLDLDTPTANLVSALARILGLSKLEVIRRALEQTTASAMGLDESAEVSEAAIFRAGLVSVFWDPEEADVGELSERETFLLLRLVQGETTAEIASKLNSSEQVIRKDLYALKIKLHHRVITNRQLQTRISRSGSRRLQAFNELQRRLHLSAAQAAEWQNAVHEARR